MKHVFIIAEAGVNHNGSIDIAKKLIDKAKEVGADAVKFQSFIASNFVSNKAEKAEYQKKLDSRTESQFEMIRRLELDENAHIELIKHCKEVGITFLSSPFDLDSIDLLNKLGLETLKIPSSEIINFPYLNKLGKLNKNIILSTGMADLGEIEDAVDVLINSGTEKEKITILHCNTEYPTPFEDVNLRSMLTIKNAFKVKVGYSDHTEGIEAPIAAVALGAEVIEKHITLDCNMEGPDHRVSLEPNDFKKMITSIRKIELSLGTGIKKPSISESKNIEFARGRIVAKTNIVKGEILTETNIMIKRNKFGLSAKYWNLLITTHASKDFSTEDGISL